MATRYREIIYRRFTKRMSKMEEWNNMKTIYELNEKDIVSVVAERFDIEPECVHVSYDNVTTGYGVVETTKPTIKIQITMDKEIDEVLF